MQSPVGMLMLIVIGFGQWACEAFIVKNQLKHTIIVEKRNGGFEGFYKHIDPGHEKPCNPPEKGCHDQVKKNEKWEEAGTVSLAMRCSKYVTRDFDGPRDAMFRFNYIDPNDKSKGVRVTVFDKEIEDDSHIIKRVDLASC